MTRAFPILGLLPLLLGSCSGELPPAEITEAELGVFKVEPQIRQPDYESGDAMVALGERLFSDSRLSANGDVSCAHCHRLQSHGVDNLRLSVGTGGTEEWRNTPSVYNAWKEVAQGWGGSTETIEREAIENALRPSALGLETEEALVGKLRTIEGMEESFQESFPGVEPLSATNFGRALGAFLRTLETAGRWQDFLAGDQDALSNTEKHGLKAFVSVGCTTCHNGPMVGGAVVQKMGLVETWVSKDRGKMEATGDSGDRYFFRVPMLLNVEKTSPYYSDGSKDDLYEIVREMARINAGRRVSNKEIDLIVAFLEALTGNPR